VNQNCEALETYMCDCRGIYKTTRNLADPFTKGLTHFVIDEASK
jgi:hypothetical protein